MSSSTLPELTKQLVRHVAPDLDVSAAALVLLREIKADAYAGSRKEWVDVEASLEGSVKRFPPLRVWLADLHSCRLVRTARVRVQDDLADALERTLRQLQRNKVGESMDWEGEMPIKVETQCATLKHGLILVT